MHPVLPRRTHCVLFFGGLLCLTPSHTMRCARQVLEHAAGDHSNLPRADGLYEFNPLPHDIRAHGLRAKAGPWEVGGGGFIHRIWMVGVRSCRRIHHSRVRVPALPSLSRLSCFPRARAHCLRNSPIHMVCTSRASLGMGGPQPFSLQHHCRQWRCCRVLRLSLSFQVTRRHGHIELEAKTERVSSERATFE